MSDIQTTAQGAESAGHTSKDTGKEAEGHAKADFVEIRSILPLLPLAPAEEGAVLVTERLFLRPIAAGDLEALHALRSRPLVMVETRRGTPDRNLDETREHLAGIAPPPGVGRQKMLYAICLKQDSGSDAGAARCGEMIGIGGVHAFRSDETGWPEFGYMLHDAHWGKGYMTEFVRGYLTLYAALPRSATPVPLRVKRITLTPEDLAAAADTDDGVPVVEEKLTAIVAVHNAGSLGVVRKTGFTEIAAYVEEAVGSGPEVPVLVYQVHPGRLAVDGKAA